MSSEWAKVKSLCSINFVTRLSSLIQDKKVASISIRATEQCIDHSSTSSLKLSRILLYVNAKYILG